jgi:hypothetical protein
MRELLFYLFEGEMIESPGPMMEEMVVKTGAA